MAPTVASVVFSTAPAVSPQLDGVMSVTAQAPFESTSGLFGSESKVVVPLRIEAERNGVVKPEQVQVPLDIRVVELMKNSLGDQATTALRGLERVLLDAMQQKDSDIRDASAKVLPAVQLAVPFAVAGDINIPPKVEKQVAKIAKKVLERTGTRVVITSAARTPKSQADAMRIKMDLGENPKRLYANKHAAGEIANAYSWAKKCGLDAGSVTDTMAMVIQRQMDSGVYISRHLHEGAVDLRSKNLNAWEKRIVKQAAIEEGAKVLMESTPPHIHIEVL
ncbi:MAG TPA: hypothetical protein VK934_04080 [Fimbriimonas sp.]|nr:hypothetical protein [Fimbriimonas sp.]